MVCARIGAGRHRSPSPTDTQEALIIDLFAAVKLAFWYSYGAHIVYVAGANPTSCMGSNKREAFMTNPYKAGELCVLLYGTERFGTVPYMGRTARPYNWQVFIILSNLRRFHSHETGAAQLA